MGWCSGSDIFYDTVDAIVEAVENGELSVDTASVIVRRLYEEMKDKDWDCDEPMGIGWVDLIMGYDYCEIHDIMYYMKYGDNCDECEEEIVAEL